MELVLTKMPEPARETAPLRLPLLGELRPFVLLTRAMGSSIVINIQREVEKRRASRQVNYTYSFFNYQL